MLIDKGVSAGEVITLKLVSGEEIIAKLVEEAISYYVVTKPMVVAITQQGSGLMPYLFTVHPDKEIKIFKSAIALVEATDKDFSNQFIQATTGIKLV